MYNIYIYNIYICIEYIYIYIYIYATNLLRHEQLCLMMFNKRYSFEILLRSLGLIKHVYNVINL